MLLDINSSPPGLKWPPLRRRPYLFKCFLSIKKLIVWFKFHWSCFLMVQLKKVSIFSGNGLAPTRRRTINRTNVDPFHRRIYAMLVGDELQTLCNSRALSLCKWLLWIGWYRYVCIAANNSRQRKWGWVATQMSSMVLAMVNLRCIAYICIWTFPNHISFANVSMAGSCREGPIPWLPMTWFLVLPVHQQPWYWLRVACRSQGRKSVALYGIWQMEKHLYVFCTHCRT